MSEQLDHYINDPLVNELTAPEDQLYRPPIDYAKAAMFVILLCSFSLFAACIITIVRLHHGGEVFGTEAVLYATRISPLVLLAATVVCSRFVLIWFVRLYQRYARSETRLRCCFTPSCSEYTILALKKYGTAIGVIKSIGRLLRCKTPGGIDYP